MDDPWLPSADCSRSAPSPQSTSAQASRRRTPPSAAGEWQGRVPSRRGRRQGETIGERGRERKAGACLPLGAGGAEVEIAA